MIDSEFSIITPMFNAEKTINAAYFSLKKQKITNWEWIVVDDCSSDNSYNIVFGLALKDKRISLIKNKSNHGPLFSRLIGLKHVKNSNYVMFLDADDQYTPLAFKKIYESFSVFNPDILRFNMVSYADGNECRRTNWPKMSRLMTDKKNFLTLNKTGVQTLCFKSKCLLFNLKESDFDHVCISDDGFLNTLAFVNAESYFSINDVLTIYTIRKDSLSHSTQINFDYYMRDNHRLYLLKHFCTDNYISKIIYELAIDSCLWFFKDCTSHIIRSNQSIIKKAKLFSELKKKETYGYIKGIVVSSHYIKSQNIKMRIILLGNKYKMMLIIIVLYSFFEYVTNLLSKTLSRVFLWKTI